MKRVVLLTGGGSAGHVTPHLALLARLRALGLALHYVGQGGEAIERTLIAPTGLPYHEIDAGKLRRYWDWQNVTDLFRIAHGFLQSLWLVWRLRPVLLFSKGGFVAPPLVWATWVVGHLFPPLSPPRGGGSKGPPSPPPPRGELRGVASPPPPQGELRGVASPPPPRGELRGVASPPPPRGGLRGGRIPIVIHESDLTPGLANRLCLPFADRVCYSFPETAAHLPSDKAVYTGIPIRASLLEGDPVMGRQLCGFPLTGARPCVLVMGGSQGAAAINQAVYAALDELLATFDVCHICGPDMKDVPFATRDRAASVRRPRPTHEREGASVRRPRPTIRCFPT